MRSASHQDGESSIECIVTISIDDARHTLHGYGNGPIDAFVHALNQCGLEFDVLSYAEHSLGQGAGARAVAYVQIGFSSGVSCFGAAVDTDIEQASIQAVVSALNRALDRGCAQFSPDLPSAEFVVHSEAISSPGY